MVSGDPGVQETSAPRAEQVRIVERHDDYTVLEVACSCGAKLFVRCEHG